jgi:plastocyanin
MTSMQKILLGLVLAAAVGGGGFYLYVSRPVAAPSSQNAGLTPQPSGTEMSGEDTHEFYIDPNQSEVSFTLNELLRGEPTVVVGTTDRVDGSFTFDPEHPGDAKLGNVRVNARTLATDSPQRNGAIARFILESEQASNEFISFSPSKIEGLPASVRMGQTFDVRITGNLKIRDTGRDVIFSGPVTVESENKITMDLSAVVKRGDFGLVIPNIPFVANVQEEVALRAKLTATKEVKAAMLPSEGDGHALGETEVEVKTDEPIVNAQAAVTVTAGVQNVTISTASYFTFAPTAFTVKKGQKVRLTFKNAGGSHDFVIDELGVATNLLKSGEEQVIEFTPDKTGSFEFYCSVGNHRAQGMKGTITVE